MNKSFKIIDDFIRDIYGFVFLKESIDARIASNGLLPILYAHGAIMSIIQERRPPFADEFVRHVYPLLEVAVHWQQLKEKNGLTGEFVDACKKRMLNANAGNFFGVIFEVDMACRSLLSGWRTEFVEDCTKQGQSQIDFVFFRHGKSLAIDCRSLRFAGFFSSADLDIRKIDSAVVEHAQKFKAEHLDKIVERLGTSPDERVLVMDITAQNYATPQVLTALDMLAVPADLDALLFTWREDLLDGKENHILRAMYKSVGRIDYRYFSITYEARFVKTNRGYAFFMRPYVEPEPIVVVGQSESLEEYERKREIEAEN